MSDLGTLLTRIDRVIEQIVDDLFYLCGIHGRAGSPDRRVESDRDPLPVGPLAHRPHRMLNRLRGRILCHLARYSASASTAIPDQPR